MNNYVRKLDIKLVKGKFKNPYKGQVKFPEQMYQVFKDLKNQAKETTLAVYMNADLLLNLYEVHSVGSKHATAIYAPEIFSHAVVTRSRYIIIIHNHPSGKKEPSPQDEATMHKLIKQARVMDMYLLDFIVVAESGYWSMFEACEGGNYTLGAVA